MKRGAVLYWFHIDTNGVVPVRKILLALVMMLCLTRAALAGETVLLDGGADG